VQLVIGTILIAFPLIALWDWPVPGKPLFENLFVLDPVGTAITTLGAFMLGWSLILTLLVVVLNAQARFGVRQPDRFAQDYLVQHARATRWLFATTVTAVSAPIALAQFVQTGWAPPLVNVWGLLAGWLGGYFLAYGSLWLATSLSPAAMPLATETFPAPRFMRRLLERWHVTRSLTHREAARAAMVVAETRAADADGAAVQKAVARMGPRAHAARDWVWQRVSEGLLKLPKDLTAGIIDNRPQLDGRANPAYGLPWSGVWFTAAFSFVTFIVYNAIGLHRQAYLASEPPLPVPALAFVVLLLLNANWIFSFLTFILDRYRIPLLAPWVILATLSANSPSSDHYYRLEPSGLTRPVSPAEGAAARVRSTQPLIVVTTAGGGIQAAMWTVRVLTGLQSRGSTPRGSFADSIALISAVSGGAAGALFFASQYADSGPAGRPGFQLRSPEELETFYEAVDDAWSDSLDDVAWALVYRDFPRLLFPYLPTRKGLVVPVQSPEGEYLDRGRMLELSWERRFKASFGKLANWRSGVAEGWRPAMIFNATIAETGEPFLFSTTDLIPRESDKALFTQYGQQTFTGFYGHFDVDLVTAARLASGFPFVLPAPRAGTGSGPDDAADVPLEGHPVHRARYHLIDGGYYDNYGVTTAARWVDDVLTALQQQGDELPRTVLILQIRSFPEREFAEPEERGWPFQIYSPIAALLSVRESGQLLRAREELTWLRDKWKDGPLGPRIQFATFQFADKGAPLSFRMNPAQAQQIERFWTDPSSDIQKNIDTVQCVVDPTVRPDCPGLVRASAP
jgi:hypothetical protein